MILDGKAIANTIQNELKAKIEQFPGRKPCLAVILVGEHGPSEIYVNSKTQACAQVGILSIKKNLPNTITQAELVDLVQQMNDDPGIDGILVQLPLPPHINPSTICQVIHPAKDVDGFHPFNMGKLLLGDTDGFFPCTPLGIRVLFERAGIDVTGQQVTIVGRSNTVGKPMAAMLMQSAPGGNATVTVVHRHSKNIKELCKQADILIVAIGQANFVTTDMVKEGAVIIDVGINRIDDPASKKKYKIVGDVDFEQVKHKCRAITPVPKGIGPMTIAMLLQNTVQSYLQRQNFFHQ